MAYNLIISFVKFRKCEKTDFQKKILNMEQKNIRPDELVHLVILATYKEPFEVLKRSVEAIINSEYDKKNQIIFTLAYEERDGENGRTIFEKLRNEYSKSFKGFYGFMHPDGIEGEVRGKGSNISYSGKKMLEILDTMNIAPAKVLVTTLDADNCVGKKYFSYLSYEYLKNSHRKHLSFQPLPFFNNNFWQVSMVNRITAISSSFWQMIESNRPTRLRNFSAHAQSLETLIDTNFWSVTTIVEDGHQYWRTYFCYNGNHKVIPLFTPIYQDAVQANTIPEMLKNQYKQLRRWAWGVSDIPYVIMKFYEKRKKLPFIKTFANILRLIEGHIMWATLAIMITLNNKIILWINPNFGTTVLSYNTSYVLSRLFEVALMGLAILIYMSVFFAPRRKRRLRDSISVMMQWILLPIVTILFGSIPALDAQTRLLLGKKLEFWVTPKQVEKIKTNPIDKA
jgi:hypothetical protein